MPAWSAKCSGERINPKSEEEEAVPFDINLMTMIFRMGNIFNVTVMSCYTLWCVWISQIVIILMSFEVLTFHITRTICGKEYVDNIPFLML